MFDEPERKGTDPEGKRASIVRVDLRPKKRPTGYAPTWYVAQVPGDGGVDWGWTTRPDSEYDPAIRLNAYWQRRFLADYPNGKLE